jgi:hypothetical protein
MTWKMKIIKFCPLPKPPPLGLMRRITWEMDADINSGKAAYDGSAMGFYPSVPFPNNFTPQEVNGQMQAAMPDCTNTYDEMARIQLNSYRVVQG